MRWASAEFPVKNRIKKAGKRILFAAKRILKAAQRILFAGKRIQKAAQRILFAAKRIQKAAQRILFAAKRIQKVAKGKPFLADYYLFPACHYLFSKIIFNFSCFDGIIVHVLTNG